MMLINIALIVVAFGLQCQGATNDVQLQSIHNFRQEMLKEFTDLSKPVLDAADDLRKQLETYKVRHEQAKKAFGQYRTSIDTEACQQLSDTIIKGGDIAWNATNEIYRMMLNVSNSLAGLSDCIGWNPATTIKCYVDNIDNVVTKIKSIKPTIVGMLHKIAALSTKLEPEFLDCIGYETTTRQPVTHAVQTTKKDSNGAFVRVNY